MRDSRRPRQVLLSLLLLGQVACGDSSTEDQDGGASDSGALDAASVQEGCNQEQVERCVNPVDPGINACWTQADSCLETSPPLVSGTCLPNRGRCEIDIYNAARDCLLRCDSPETADRFTCLARCPEPHALCHQNALGSATQCLRTRPEPECRAEFDRNIASCNTARDACQNACPPL